MSDLYDVLADRVAIWRLAGYPHDRFPAIGEILQFATEGGSENGSGQLRYLRAAQLRARRSRSITATTAPDIAAIGGFVTERPT